MAQDVRMAWEDLHAKIIKACGNDKNKVALAELLCLRQFAVNTLRATMLSPAKKSRSRKQFTR